MRQPGKPKRGKGFNYKAHAKKNAAGNRKTTNRMKKAGGNLTKYKCGPKKRKK